MVFINMKYIYIYITINGMFCRFKVGIRSVGWILNWFIIIKNKKEICNS